METIRIKTNIGEAGILKVEAPVGVADVDADVILVHSIEQPETANDWEAFVNATYRSLADDPLERPQELPIDVRDWRE